MLWGRGADAPTAWARCVQEMQEMQEIQERPCGATGEAVVQSGVSRRPIGPICPIGPTAPSLWHVADVPGVQGKVEVWKLRGLEVWLSRCTTISPVARLSGVLFSVFRGRGRFGASRLHAPFSGARQRPLFFVIAAQREASPSFQASKLPSFPRRGIRRARRRGRPRRRREEGCGRDRREGRR